jgi:hypothetical protein
MITSRIVALPETISEAHAAALPVVGRNLLVLLGLLWFG